MAQPEGSILGCGGLIILRTLPTQVVFILYPPDFQVCLMRVCCNCFEPRSFLTSAGEGSPVHAVIAKIDRMKTRQGESLFLKVDVGGETVRVFGRPEELAERLEASGYDIPASEVEAGMELHLPCLVKVGQGKNGYKNIKSFCPKLPNDRRPDPQFRHPQLRVRETKASLTRIF
jgi:hypothetical protein